MLVTDFRKRARLGRFAPYLLLLAEVVMFHRDILMGRTVFPWDIRTYHLPQALFVAKALRDGELPLWNPFIYCGHPFAANIQTALFYPPRLAATLLGGVTAYRMLYSLEIELILHVFLAGCFCFVLMRDLGMGRGAALAGATSFQLGAFFASQVEHLGAIEAAAWLPLIWLLIIRGSRQRSWLNALLLSGALSMSLLSGFTPLTTVTLLSSLLLVVTLRAGPKLWGLFLGCFMASLLLCAVVFFPAVQLTLLSVSRFRSDWIGKGGGLPLASLLSLFWANSFRIYKGPYDITLMYLYSGVVTLGGVGLLFIRRRIRGVGMFAAMLVVSALFMLGESTPFGTLYSYVFPAAVRGVIYPQEWIAPFSLSLCVLGAYGVSLLTGRTWVRAALVVVAICDLTWFGSNRQFNSAHLTSEPGVTEDSFAGSKVLLETVKRAAERTRPASRIDTIDDSIDWVGSAMITEAPTAGGEDPMALARYIQARLAVVNGKRWGYYYQVSDIASPVLGSLNVCCVLTRSRVPAETLRKSAYSDVTEVPGGFLYYSDSALPRFHLVHKTVSAAGMEEAARLTKRVGWEPRDVAIVEDFQGVMSGDGVGDEVLVRRYRRNSVRLETRSGGTSFLVSSESNFPGWTARVDGRTARIYDTNVAFRGIWLSAGRHVVEFEFRPRLVEIGGVVSVVAWAVYCVLLVYFKSRRGMLF
jgi:hypothetical protein